MKKTIILATNNEHKLMEVRQILPDDFNILSLKDAGDMESTVTSASGILRAYSSALASKGLISPSQNLTHTQIFI